MLLAGVFAGLVAVLCHRIVEGDWPSLDELLGNGAPVTFPAGRLAVAVAMTVTASPHLSRPLRYAGRWVVGLGTIGTVYTQEATVGGTIAALILGAMAAAAVHLIFGSPGGRPSLREVAAAVARPGRRRPRPPTRGAPTGRDVDGARRGLGRRAAGDQGVRARRLGHPAGDPGVAVPLVPPLVGSLPHVPREPGGARGPAAPAGAHGVHRRAEGQGGRAGAVRRHHPGRSSRSRSRERSGPSTACGPRSTPHTTPACRRARSTSTTSGGPPRATGSSAAGRAG